jgi:hypothetical protein
MAQLQLLRMRTCFLHPAHEEEKQSRDLNVFNEEEKVIKWCGSAY